MGQEREASETRSKPFRVASNGPRRSEKGEVMKPEELGAVAVGAILAGTDLTLHLPAGEKWPQGWPRGELLSVTERGRNYSFNPLKVLAFMQRLGKLDNGKAPNV